MGKRSSRIIFFAILIVCVATSERASSHAVKDTSMRAISINEPLHLEQAIADGDTAALDDVLSKSITPKVMADIYRWYALAGKARIRGDIKSSSAYAKKCYETATTQAIEHHKLLSYALSCGKLLAGNELLQGKISAWASTLLRVAEENRKALDWAEKLSAADDDQFLGTPGLDLHAFAQLPDLVVEKSHRALSTLPRVTSDAKAGVSSKELAQLPYVQVTINGRPATALLDTGAYASAIPSSKVAELGLQATGLAYFQVNDRLYASQPIHSKLAMARRVQVGDTVLKNLRFNVVDRGPVILGLDALSNMAPFIVMRKDDVQLYGAMPNIACKNDMQLQSALLGPASVAMKQELQSSKGSYAYPFFLDTGMGVETFASRRSGVRSSADWPVTWQTTVSGAHAQTFDHGSLTLLVHGQPYPVSMTVHPQFDIPNVYGFGGFILRKFDLGLDFIHQKGCLLPMR